MSDILNDILGAEEQTAPQGPSDGDLAAISDLAMQQLFWEEEVARIGEMLKEAERNLRHVSEQALPDAMATVGMLEFKLLDGSRILIKEDVAASIKADGIKGAVEFLEERGLGGVIKDEIKINLGRGEAELATRFLELAKSLDVPASEKLSVHPSTLKSLVKEQLEQGVEFPEEFFSVYPYKKAVIKAPGKK